MRKKHLNRLLANLRFEVVQRRAIQNSENNDIRRVKSLMRTQLKRKTNVVENKWVTQEVVSRGKKYLKREKGLDFDEYNRYENVVEMPPDLAILNTIKHQRVFPSMYFFLERVAEARYERLSFEKRILDVIYKVPLWEGWAKDVKGLGELNLANILSESGDLWRFDNPAKLWKYMGVGIVGEHGIQRKSRDKKLAKEFGYSPARRGIMFVTSESLMKGSREGKGIPGPYKIMYDVRKEYEMGKDEVMNKIHAHRRALRYIGKHLLKEMWKAWRVHCP